jgi:pimeloyl-ACP methyl ester carboxylesterase
MKKLAGAASISSPAERRRRLPDKRPMMSKVISKDGTGIAYERIGQGPALILVDGALTYRAFGPMPELAKLLAPHFTVTTYDRRGRGGSGDSEPYTLEGEVEDIDALIDDAGKSAFIFGSSSGACLALEAAIQLGQKVRKLALYEPPYHSGDGALLVWKDYRRQLSALLSAGRRGEAVVLFMQLVGTPPEQVEGLRQSPLWPMLEAVAPTLAYDAAAMGPERLVPVEFASIVAAPVLVMNGTSVPFMFDTAKTLAKALPHARQLTLEGQGHDVDLKILAPKLVEFFYK